MAVTASRYEMSDEHKAHLAIGREQSRIVKNYLEALIANAPKAGRKRTAESVERQLTETVELLAEEKHPFRRLRLISDRERLERELVSFGGADMSEMEVAFVRVAADFSARKGVSYQAWRQLGVPAATLKAAGVSRALSRSVA